MTNTQQSIYQAVANTIKLSKESNIKSDTALINFAIAHGKDSIRKVGASPIFAKPYGNK